MRVVTAVLTSRLRRLPAYLLATGLLVTGFSMDPALASGSQGGVAVELLAEFRDSDDQIRSLFEGAGIHADMGGRASIFAQRDGVTRSSSFRYAAASGLSASANPIAAAGC